MKIIDISLPVHTKMVIYPRNPRLRVKRMKTPTSTISALTIGTHTGAHVDAPRHVFATGQGVGEMDLRSFVGPCRVLNLTAVRGGITVTDLKNCTIASGERILLKTRNSKRGFRRFYSDYTFVTSEAAEFLAEKKVALVGIDSLSIKRRGALDNRPHTALLAKKIPIVEGLDLSKVRAGNYFFIGLPLRLTGLDGSPIRAVLVQ